MPARLTRLVPGSPRYPSPYLRRVTPPHPVLTCRGNPDLLSLPLLGLLCSSEVPPDLVLPSLDLMIGLRTAGVAVAGGFQSRLEKDWLAVLLRGVQPVVIAPARAIDGMAISGTLGERLAGDSVLLVCPFGDRLRRPSVELALKRNELLLSISDRLMVVSAGPGSRAIRCAASALEAGKAVFCFDHPRNRDLLLLGAWPIEPLSRRHPIDEALLTPASPACR